MKRIFIGITALLLILSACTDNKSTTKSDEILELEKDAVEFFSEYAEENDLTIILDHRASGAEAKEYNEFIKDSGFFYGEYESTVTYVMYNDDAESIVDFSISAYKSNPTSSYFYGTACVVDKNVVEYYGYYETKEEFEYFCDDIDGKLYERNYE